MTERPGATHEPYGAVLQFVRDSFARQGLVGTLGAWLIELEPGRASIEIPYSHRVAGQGGRFHSAVVAGIAQACGGTAAATLAAEGIAISPTGFSMTFSAVPEGDLLVAVGRASSDGETRWTAQVTVTCRKDGILVTCAEASLSFEMRSGRAPV